MAVTHEELQRLMIRERVLQVRRALIVLLRMAGSRSAAGSVLELAGLAAIVAGIWQFSAIFGLISAGIALFLTGFFIG